MAFSITITSDLRSIIAELVAPWRCADTYVPSSGALTIERILKQRATATRVHGASPDLIAAAAGSYYAGLPFRLPLQPAAQDRLGWLAASLGDPAAALATVLVVSQFAKALSRGNTFYQRYVDGLRLQWPTLHAKALAKVKADVFKLDSYIVAGVTELLGLLDEDAGVVTHAGMWKRDLPREALLASIFDWDAPEVVDLTPAAKAEAIAAVTDREHWLLITNEPIEELTPSLRAKAQGSLRGVPSYVYAPDGVTRLVRPRQKVAPLLAPRLTAGQELQGELTLALLPTEQFNSLRAAYLASGIRPGGAAGGLATQSVAVLVGGMIVGAYALSFDPTLCTIAGAAVPTPTVYLLSDFAVGPTDYPRLSKLVVMAALSVEARLLAERKLAQRWRGVVTTAFSQHPVSMKYRGLLDLISRSETASPDITGGTGYKLTYGGAFGRWSLAEALATWQAKHGERRATKETL